MSYLKKLDYIEKFLEEFYITGRNNLGIFRLTSSDKKNPQFDEIINKNKNIFE